MTPARQVKDLEHERRDLVRDFYCYGLSCEEQMNLAFDIFLEFRDKFVHKIEREDPETS